MHPICPGDGRWYLTAPVFEKIVIDLGRSGGVGKKFTILALGAGRGRTKVRKVFLNGCPLDRSWISHDELISGGTLAFELDDGFDASGHEGLYCRRVCTTGSIEDVFLHSPLMLKPRRHGSAARPGVRAR